MTTFLLAFAAVLLFVTMVASFDKRTQADKGTRAYTVSLIVGVLALGGTIVFTVLLVNGMT